MKRTVAVVIAFFAGIAGAIACGEALSEDEIPAPERDAGGDGNANAEGDGGTVIVTDAGLTCTCLPAVPDGWEGPFLSDELATCAAPWGQARGDVHADLDAGRHLCTCSCAAATPNCRVHGSNSLSCGDLCGPAYDPTPYTTCFQSFDGTGCEQFTRIEIDGGGPCTPTAGQTIDTPGWQRTVHRCEGAVTAGVCPGATNAPCVEKPSATGEICISHVGEQPCPPAYGLKRLYYTSIADDRACSACTCGDAGAPCEVAVYSDAGCANQDRAGSFTTYCSQSSMLGSYAKLIRKAQACAPSGAQTTGAATPSAPVTWCCRPQ